MKKRLLFLTCFIFCCALSLLAQQKITVTGTVTDEKGLPMESVAVKQSGSKTGTLTNGTGKFTLLVTDANATLEFSFIGYATLKEKLSGKTDVAIVMTADNKNSTLRDVVVVGQQTQSRRKTTTAISSVSGKDIQNLPAPSVDQLLQGRVAGLNVQIGSGEPGVAPTIVVRGNSRVSTGISDNNVSQARALSTPLYVIDGVPVNPEDIANSSGLSGGITGTNYLAGININDIESIDVQKDAAATAAWVRAVRTA